MDENWILEIILNIFKKIETLVHVEFYRDICTKTDFENGLHFSAAFSRYVFWTGVKPFRFPEHVSVSLAGSLFGYM